jgi:hypothetical protein
MLRRSLNSLETSSRIKQPETRATTSIAYKTHQPAFKYNALFGHYPAKVLSEVYGLVVETFVPLKGESNAVQVVHLLIRMNDTRYAVEIIDEDADTVQLMSSISKAIDLGIKFIVAIDEGRAEKLAQLLNTSMFIIVPYRSGDEIADLIMRRLEIVA